MPRVGLQLSAAVLLFSLACGEPPGGEQLRSQQARISSPVVSPEARETLARDNLAFALDLYAKHRQEGGNLFFSPHSISVALAMTYAGARGETEKQIASAMHFSLPQAELHPAFNELDLQLASRGQGAKGKDGAPFTLRVVNASWGQQGFAFEGGYLDTLALHYGAGLRLLDFQRASDASRTTINDWVAYRTENRIRDLLPKGSVDDSTRLVLTNAVYFNAAWKKAFDAAKTAPRPFSLLDGSIRTVPSMTKTERLAFSQGHGLTAVEIPYDGEELSMMALMPDQDFETFETGLNPARLQQALQALSKGEVELTMPKLKIERALPLKKALATLGVVDAFDPDRADFSGMSSADDLYIQDALHKAFLEVNESGTEAAAASGVVIGTRTAIESPVQVTLDRPFLLLIRDTQTGAVLFLGRVVEP